MTQISQRTIRRYFFFVRICRKRRSNFSVAFIQEAEVDANANVVPEKTPSQSLPVLSSKLRPLILPAVATEDDDDVDVNAETLKDEDEEDPIGIDNSRDEDETFEETTEYKNEMVKIVTDFVVNEVAGKKTKVSGIRGK